MVTRDEMLRRQVRVATSELAEHLRRLTTDDIGDEEATYARMRSALDRALESLAETDCWGPANRPLSTACFWEPLSEWLLRGDLQSHARLKPRGYAGDFELLDKICRDARCADPLGRFFDRFFQEHAAPRAVRNRARIVADEIVSTALRAQTKSVRFVSVGSGPAHDLALAAQRLEEDTRRVRADLIDIDPEALTFARRRLSSLMPSASLRFMRENLFRVHRRATTLDLLSGADLIACVGLFDYLDDRVAIDMVRAFWRALGPGGCLMVFNFAKVNPSRSLMEWIGNWYLTYRDRDDLRRIAYEAGIPGEKCEIGVEDEGVNLFLLAKSP